MAPVKKTTIAGKKVKNNEREVPPDEEVADPANKKKKSSRYPVSKGPSQVQKNTLSSAIPDAGDSSSQVRDTSPLQDEDTPLDVLKGSNVRASSSASTNHSLSKLVQFFSDPLHGFGDSELGNACAGLAHVGRSLLGNRDSEHRSISKDLPPHFISSLSSLVIFFFFF